MKLQFQTHRVTDVLINFKTTWSAESKLKTFSECSWNTCVISFHFFPERNEWKNKISFEILILVIDTELRKNVDIFLSKFCFFLLNLQFDSWFYIYCDFAKNRIEKKFIRLSPSVCILSSDASKKIYFSLHFLVVKTIMDIEKIRMI